MKIHIFRIQIQGIADFPAAVLHAEILHLVPEALKLTAYFKNIGFRTAVRVKKFIYDQNLQ